MGGLGKGQTVSNLGAGPSISLRGNGEAQDKVRRDRIG